MQKHSLQKRLGPYTINKELFRTIEQYINQQIPRILLLNLEKGRENPLSDSIIITVQHEHIKKQLLSIDYYKQDTFEPDIKEVSLELVHDNRFNYLGHKIIVLIMAFDLEKGYCNLSIALHDDAPKERIAIIEKGVRSAIGRFKKSRPLVKLFQL